MAAQLLVCARLLEVRGIPLTCLWRINNYYVHKQARPYGPYLARDQARPGHATKSRGEARQHRNNRWYRHDRREGP